MYKVVQPANVGHTAAKEEHCFVSGTLGRVLRVSKYLGTAPLRFEKTENGWRFRLSPAFSIFSGLVISVTGILSMKTNFSDKFNVVELERLESSLTQRMMRLAESLLMALIAMWMIYNAPSHMKHLVCCLKEVRKIHSDLKITHWPQQNTKYVAMVIIWIFFCIILIVSEYVTMSIFSSHETLWIKIFDFLYYIHYVVIQTRVVQFMFIVTHVNSNFLAINQYLKTMLRDIEKKKKIDVCLLGNNTVTKLEEEYVKVNNYIDSIDSVTIEKVKDANKSSVHSGTFYTLNCAYGASCQVMRSLNRTEGTMLMFVLAFLFLHLLTSPYFFVTNILYGDYALDNNYFVFYGTALFSWTFLHLYNLFLIIEPCHQTHLEIDVTRELLSHLMRITESAQDPLTADIDQFYKNLVTNRVYYQPLNVIMICRGLIIEIIGSVTTYLVILIQIK